MDNSEKSLPVVPTGVERQLVSATIFTLESTKADGEKTPRYLQCVQFTPERKQLSNRAYTHALVDSDDLEWIELSADAKDYDPAHDGGSTGGVGSGEDGDNPSG